MNFLLFHNNIVYFVLDKGREEKLFVAGAVSDATNNFSSLGFLSDNIKIPASQFIHSNCYAGIWFS